jgi:ribosomal-protein-alanine N-acetyltransferase
MPIQYGSVQTRSIRTGPLPRVRARALRETDEHGLVTMNVASRSFHRPWVSPPITQDGFRAYLQRTRSGSTYGFVLEAVEDGGVVGIVNLSNVVRDALKGAAMGYYANQLYAGRGLMREGIEQILDQAFDEFDLHRIEANVQPGNDASLAIVKRLGFRQEGLSPRFLFVEGEWRDHERWALLSEEWSGTWKRSDPA